MTHLPAPVVMILAFLAMIGPLVLVHELGHYLAGRLFGVKVDSFSIGMGRELVGWTDRQGTRWKLSALPIGGYVKFAGDMGPASQPDPAAAALPAADRARTLGGRPVWQRFIVVAAGPVTNFVAAIAIFAAYFAITGVPQTPTTIARILPGSPAAQAGMLPGDRIVRIDGRGVSRFEDVVQVVTIRSDKAVPLEVERGGRRLLLQVRLRGIAVDDGTGNRVRLGLLGVTPGVEVKTRPGLLPTIAAAADHSWASFRQMLDVIGQIVGGDRSAKELGGPLKIAQYSGKAVSLGWDRFVTMMALVSINLGFVNLLPIPILDGGHLVLYVMEGVRRRPLPVRAEVWAFRSGMALLLGFMTFVTVNDLASFGLWRRLAGLIG